MVFDMATMAARIRGKRAELNLTQEDLAERIDVSPDLISKYESAVHRPGSDKLFALAQALDTTPNYLLGWDDS